MDYIGNKCPVCDKYFHIGDDIVVCPECGTPAHRQCYEETGKCIYHDKHKDGFEYKIEANTQADDNKVICKKCGQENSKEAFFCTKCGSSLYENPQKPESTQGTEANSPFGANSPYQNVIIIDPLAGVKPESDIGDGITAGEMAKFVKTNTPYFVRVFSNIKQFTKSRFNFCGALFSGAYLLYRKMYKLGAFITAVHAAMMILSFYLSVYMVNSSSFSGIFDAWTKNDILGLQNAMAQLSAYDTFVIYLSAGLEFAMLALMLVCGLCVNRLYYNHCKKQITKIKATAKDKAEYDTLVSKKGGVNNALAVSLFVSYLIIQWLPYLFI